MSKNTYLAIISSVLCCAMPLGFSLPSHPQVCSGTAEVEHIDSHTMQITPSHQAILHYQDFQIGAQEKVRFIQDSSKSCVLNRITGENPSQILGSLESNGKVFLVNPNGIYFGADSKVNVGSLIASTLDIADEDFLQETYRFSLSQGNNSSIVNEGYLHSAEGSIVLLAPSIHNLGHIQAQAGSVLLASGEHVTLDFTGDGLIQFSVEGSLKEALIEHLGKIEGSIVSMKLPVAKRAITEILNMDGADEAEVFIEENGVIKFAASSQIKAHKVSAEGSQISVLGSIDASSALDKGGEVHLFGKDIFLVGAKIDASGLIGGGEVLIGGEFQGKGKTPYASSVTMDELSEIYASALETGKGGLVVLWSQDHTVFNGKIFAKGGSLGGDGGLVETSSKGDLGIISGHVNALAQKGTAGEWLLDPNNLFINTSGGAVSCTNPCTSCYFGGCTSCSTAYPDTVNVNTINSACANVTLQSCYLIYLESPIQMVNQGVGVTFNMCNNSVTRLSIIEKNITTNGGAITLSSYAGLSTSSQGCGSLTITFDTTNGGAYPAGAPVNVPNIYSYVNVSGCSSAHFNLTINAGSSAVTVNPIAATAIEGTSGNNFTLGTLTIGSASSVTANGMVLAGNLQMPNIPLIVNGTIDTTSGGKVSGGSINVGSLDGSSSSSAVVLKAGTGSITIGGNVGTTTSPASFSIQSAGSLSLSSVTTSGGSISITPAIALNSNANMTSNNGLISFGNTVSGASYDLVVSAGSGSVAFGGAVQTQSFTLASGSITSWPSSLQVTGGLTFTPAIAIDSGTTLNLTGNPITFASTLDGPGGISLSGPVSFTGAVGGNSSLSSFSLTSGSITSWPSNLTATSISFTPAVVISSGQTATVTGNTVFSSMVDGPGSLALYGTISLSGAVGGTTNLSSFSLGSGSVTSWPNISTSGNISLSPAVTINSSPTFTSSGGTIQFSDSITGTGNLTLNGLVSFASTLSLANFTLSGGSITSWPSSMTATSALTFTPAISIPTGVIPSLTGGTITFASTLDGSGGIALNGGTISLLGVVGGSSALASFTLASGSVATWSNISTTGNISITPAVTINSSPTFTSSEGAIAFSNNVTGTGSLTLNGATSFLNTSALSLDNFNLFSGSITSWPSSMTATGALIFTPAVSINSGEVPTLAGSTITFSNTLDGSGGVALNGGTINLVGVVGGVSSLSSFTVNSGSVASWSNISTTGNISFFPAISINSSPTFTSSAGTIQFFDVITGTGSLTLNGAASFASTLSLANFTLSSGSITSWPSSMTATETLTFTPAISIPSGEIPTLTGNTITFSNAVNGPGSLILNGNSGGVNFNGAVGEATALSSLQITSTTGPIAFASTLDVSGSIAITGNSGSVTFSGNVGSNTSPTTFQVNLSASASFASNVSAGTITITPVAIFTATSNLTSSNSITFGNPINGPGNLTLTGGTIFFGGTVGSSPALASFTMASGSVNTWYNIITSGAIDIFPAITIASNPTFTSENGPITFENTVQGPGAVTINGNSGSVTFSGAVGSNAALSSLVINSGSSATFASNVSAGTISITPTAIFTGTCNVTGSTSIAFGNVINGPGSLTLAGGTITFGGAVGSSPALTSFTLASGSVTNTPSSINTTDALTLTPSVTLSGPLSLNSINGPITTSAIDGSSIGGQSLTINAGAGSFSVGDLGTGTALGQVQLTSTLSSFIESIITSSQSITVNASTSQIQNNLFPITFLTDNSRIDSANGGISSGASISLGPIAANSTGTGAQTLTINATSSGGATALITLYGELGGDDQPLGSLTIEGTPSSSIPEVYIAGSISTSSIVGGAGGAITIDPQITLTGPSIMSTISANSPGAPIVLNDLYANNLQSLSLLSGSGFISTGDLGSFSYPLSSISLTGGAITLNGPVYASGSIGSMSIINSGALAIQSGAITLSGSFNQQGNGAVTLGSNITANGGILSLQSIVSLTQPITLTSSSDLTLSSQVTSSVSSELTLSSTGGAIYAAQLGTTGSPLGAVTFSAKGLSSLAGIVTNNGAIDIRAPILLTSQLTVLDTTAGTSSGFVRFQNTVDATNTGSLAEALQIVTEGSSVTFDAALGGDAPLGGLDISSTGSVTIGGSIFTTSSSASSLAGSIQINGPVTLSGDFLATIEIDTTEGGGAEIFFAESISGEPSLILDASSSSITFGADVEGLGSLTVESAGTVAIQNISVEELVAIPQSITLSLDTSIQSQTGDIVLGSIDGAFDLTVATNDGKITLGVLGAATPLDQVTVESAAQVSIQNMTTSGAITLTIPIILLDSTTLNTTAASALGAAITLGSVNASIVGGQSLTINAGTSEVVLQGDIGTIISPSDLDVTAGALYLENASIFTNGMQQYHSPVLVAQDIVFRSKGNITFDEMVDPVSTPSNLSLYPGGGTLTFASSVGDAPFGKVGVFNAGSFISQDIFASSLVVAGGLSSVYLEGNISLSGEGGIRIDAGPIFFGGSIEAQFLFFRSNGGNIANLNSLASMTSTGTSFLDVSYFNAIDGVVGSEQSPIGINTSRLLIVGADPRADFIGNPFHDAVRLARGNRPCTVVFNGVTIINCDSQSLSIREIFNSIAKDLFYVPGLYSSWDNLSNLEYFQQEPVDLGFNPRNRKLFYSIGPAEKRSLITQILSGCTRLQKVEEEILQGKALKPEFVSWEFSVDLPDESFFLDLLPLSK